jgi:hypothetical protein
LNYHEPGEVSFWIQPGHMVAHEKEREIWGETIMLTLVVVLFVICLSRMSPKKAKTSRQSGEEEASVAKVANHH